MKAENVAKVLSIIIMLIRWKQIIQVGEKQGLGWRKEEHFTNLIYITSIKIKKKSSTKKTKSTHIKLMYCIRNKETTLFYFNNRELDSNLP